MAMAKGRLYLVELVNYVDRRDNEAMRVYADSPAEAQRMAGLGTRGRFSVGRVVLYTGNKTKADRELAAELRSICAG